jgi:hypothetical protein
VPFITGQIWRVFGDDIRVLPALVTLFLLLPLPVLFIAPTLTYQDQVGCEEFIKLRRKSQFQFNVISRRVTIDNHDSHTNTVTDKIAGRAKKTKSRSLII